MKSSRAHFILAAIVCGSLCCALLIALGGYFRAVEKSGGAVGTEKHLLTQLKIFHERLKAADSPEEAKAALKMAESITGLGPESELARELRKSYAPVVAIFASKPREAELRFALAKKRELMDNLVNAYRKEIPHGEISVRAAYLNILFGTQASLLSETDEAEQVFLKRNRERLDGLRTAVNGRDAGLVSRVAAIAAIFQSYDRGLQQAIKWRAEKTEALAKQEKALPSIAKAVFAREDSNVEETRRGFLYVCFLALLIACASFFCLYIGFKILRVRAELKWESFLTYLKAFGSEQPTPQVTAVLDTLRGDADWAPVIAEAQRAEEAFLRSCQSLLAVPRSLVSPFLVVAKDRTIRYWNESAQSLFALVPGKEWGIQDLLQPTILKVKDGEIEPVLELVRSAMGSIDEARFELLVKQGGTWLPYELSMSPITIGPLAGGKIFLWREISSEAERVDRAVANQLERICELVHKVTHQYEVQLLTAETDAPAVRAMISDLALLKERVEERQTLWRSEAQALSDQVTRQQDILRRLADELGRIRTGQAEALQLVMTAHGGEEHLHDEVCVLERDLERWAANRQRLVGDIRQQSAVLERAKSFEEQLRSANERMRTDLDHYQKGLEELRQFADAAKVHSVNLGLVRDPALWEYASRARAFAHELVRFTSLAEDLGRKVQAFLSAHPGGALAAHLRGPALDESLLAGITEEQEKLSVQLRRWKESAEVILGEGERAVTVLQNAEKASAVVTQLGETSLLINEQARGNLERWN